MDSTRNTVITEGCIILLQRGSFMKNFKVILSRPIVFGGKRDGLQINFHNAVGEPFGSSFKLVKATDGRRVCSLQKLTWEQLVNKDLSTDEKSGESGVDNRDLTDDCTSQKLTKEEIEQLKHSGASGKQVIDTLTANSVTFSSKTKYSQEKYVSKKSKKYDEFVTIHKPTVDLIADMFFSQIPHKIMYLRPDTLFQLLLHSNVYAGGRAALFESHTLNLVAAGMLHRLGSTGRLVHVFSGQKPFHAPVWTAVDLLDLNKKQLSPVSHININRLQHAKAPGEPNDPDMELLIDEDEDENVGMTEGEVQVHQEQKAKDLERALQNPNKRCKFVPSLRRDEEISRSVLESGVFSLVVACKHHPLQPTMALYPYLLPGCPFAVFSSLKEPLMELYQELKCRGAINLHLSETWLREYQVLPERTHPMVNMSGAGGYILVGTKLKVAT